MNGERSAAPLGGAPALGSRPVDAWRLLNPARATRLGLVLGFVCGGYVSRPTVHILMPGLASLRCIPHCTLIPLALAYLGVARERGGT